MKRSILLYFLLIFAFFGCDQNSSNPVLNKSYIKTFYELDPDCVELIKNAIEPFHFEDEKSRINKIYDLYVDFDTTIYDPDNIPFNCIIGIEFEHSPTKLTILSLNVEFGTIAFCQELPDNRLIINNTDFLSTDLIDISIWCFGLDTANRMIISEPEPAFIGMAWTSVLYGKWTLKKIIEGNLPEKLVNADWIFERENWIKIISSDGSMLVDSEIELQGMDLQFNAADYSFEILTVTNSAIVLKDRESNSLFSITKEIDW